MTLIPRIVEVTADNLADHTGVICFINPKNEYYDLKVGWLKDQFKLGLRIKLIYIEGEKSPKGFIEYVPGEFCWRPVKAKGYLFIHCLWTHDKKYRNRGLGKKLIYEAENDASGMNGVAVLTSDRSFMVKSKIFLKNSYRLTDTSGKDQLLVKQFRNAPLPVFNKSSLNLNSYKGLTIIYSKQCPWVARFIEEVRPLLEKENLKPDLIEIKTHIEAQNAPSVYGVFNLICDGKLLADRYISTTRFVNIIKKEIK
jgi:hypothetical protein